MVIAGSLALAAAAPAAPVRAFTAVEGTIASVKASAITVVAKAGANTRVVMNSRTCVAIRRPATIEEIAPGEFVGVAAKKAAGGALTATFVNLFPGGLKGCIPTGQRLMESGDIITNAIVATATSHVAGRRLTLTYEGETATIAVPRGTPVHRLMLIPRGSLRPGMGVLVRGAGNADGSITATVIVVQ